MRVTTRMRRFAAASASAALAVAGCVATAGAPALAAGQADDQIEEEALADSVFLQVADQIEAEYPDTFAGAMVAEGRYQVGFAGEKPAGVDELMATTGRAFAVVENLGFSEAAQDAAVRAVGDALRADLANARLTVGPETLAPVIDVAVDPASVSEADIAALSTATGDVDVVTTMGDDLTADAHAAAVGEAVATMLSAVADAEGFRIELSVRAISPAVQQMYGGMALRDRYGYKVCTAGFTAVRASGATGVLTAGHCSPYVAYYGEAQLAKVAAVNGRSGDMAFYKYKYPSGKTNKPQFQYVAGKNRTVIGQNSPRVGASLCKYGISSGRTCGQVFAVNQLLAFDDGTYTDGLALMTGVSRPGDSGGPVYNGRYAVGILIGGAKACDSKGRNCTPVIAFEPVNKALTLVGARIMTGRA